MGNKEEEKVQKEDQPLYPIGIAAELVGATDQTLRLYEKHGLVTPAKKNRNRYYSDNDVRWLRCVRGLIHEKKISIEGIKRLLNYAPCWEIMGCSDECREDCSAFINRATPCWELTGTRCRKDMECDKCVVFIASRKREGK